MHAVLLTESSLARNISSLYNTIHSEYPICFITRELQKGGSCQKIYNCFLKNRNKKSNEWHRLHRSYNKQRLQKPIKRDNDETVCMWQTNTETAGCKVTLGKTADSPKKMSHSAETKQMFLFALFAFHRLFEYKRENILAKLFLVEWKYFLESNYRASSTHKTTLSLENMGSAAVSRFVSESHLIAQGSMVTDLWNGYFSWLSGTRISKSDLTRRLVQPRRTLFRTKLWGFNSSAMKYWGPLFDLYAISILFCKTRYGS